MIINMVIMVLYMNPSGIQNFQNTDNLSRVTGNFNIHTSE